MILATNQPTNQPYSLVFFACNQTEYYREIRTSFVCEIAGQERSFCMLKYRMNARHLLKIGLADN